VHARRRRFKRRCQLIQLGYWPSGDQRQRTVAEIRDLLQMLTNAGGNGDLIGLCFNGCQRAVNVKKEGVKAAA